MKKLLISFIQVLAYLLVVFLVLALLVIPATLIWGDLDLVEARMQILLLGVQLVLAVAVVNSFLVRFFRSQLVRLGWPGPGASARWFGIGALVGLLMCGALLGIILICGGGRLTFNSDGLSQYAGYVLPLVFFILIATLGEEWIFRGYPMNKLSPLVGRGWANVIVGLMFMAGHWGGDGWTALAALNIFLFSLVNGAMRFTPGGIAAAWGFHFAWNGLHVFLGATLSGQTFAVPAIRFQGMGPAWLSGGAFGPEGAVGTTVVTVVGLLLIRRFLWRNRKGYEDLRI